MPAFNVRERIQSIIPVDVNATNYSWSALEIALLFFVVFMIAFAIFIVCCA